jgi:hypothetical protein
MFWDGACGYDSFVGAFLTPFVKANVHSPRNNHVLGWSCSKEGKMAQRSLFDCCEVSMCICIRLMHRKMRELWDYVRERNENVEESERIVLLAVADWKAIERYLGLRASGAKGSKEGTCFLCNFTNNTLPSENGDEFDIQKTTHNTDVSYNNSHFPLHALRYDPLHGIARLLCFLLSSIVRQLESRRATSFRNSLSTRLLKCPDPIDDKCLGKIKPKEAAIILEDDELIREMSKELEGSSYRIPPMLYGAVSLPQVTPSEGFYQLMVSMRNYRRFTRLRFFTEEAILAFDTSWQYIQATISVNKWKATPSAHYMLNHYLEKVLVDAEASFLVLQEGGEHTIGEMSNVTYFCQNTNKRALELLKHAMAISNLHLDQTNPDFWIPKGDEPRRDFVTQNLNAKRTPWAVIALTTLISLSAQ